jgi:hypothetical protein
MSEVKRFWVWSHELDEEPCGKDTDFSPSSIVVLASDYDALNKALLESMAGSHDTEILLTNRIDALAARCAELIEINMTTEGQRARLKERCAKLEALLRESMRGHYQCDDPWYSCPLNPEGCADERQTECTCGASAWNAKVLVCFAVADGEKP